MNDRKSLNKRWKDFKEILYKGAVRCLGFKSHDRITKEVVNKMEEKREEKKINTKEDRKKYRRLNTN